MQKQIAAAACGVVLVAVALTAVARGADAPVWNPRAAASYLDQRADWWTTWQGRAETGKRPQSTRRSNIQER